MGSQFSAPVKLRSERATRGIVALLLVVGVLAAITITGSGVAGATSLSGGFSPRVFGGLIDITGDRVVDTDDSSDNFFRLTDLDSGYLDCNAWSTTKNSGSEGNHSGGGGDTCTLQGVDGSTDGIFIYVVDGVIDHLKDSVTDTLELEVPEGWLMPTIYRTSSPTSTTLSSADWAWAAYTGRVDWNHSGGTTFSSSDCAENVVGAADICTDSTSSYGYIDLNDDNSINGSDSCFTGCFFGYNVEDGMLQVERGFEGAAGTTGATGPTGAAGKDGVSGRVSVTTTTNTNSTNKGKTTLCSGTTKVLGGGYSITGDTTVLAHLTVVANGPVSGGWRVRVIEATPTSGSWSVTVTAICADA